MTRGDIWWAELEHKRRPVVILTREAAIPVIRTVLVAPLTRRLRWIPTQVVLDESDGVPTECAVSLDNVTVVDKALLTEKVTHLPPSRIADVCHALNLAVGC